MDEVQKLRKQRLFSSTFINIVIDNHEFKDYSVDHITEFITEKVFGEYYNERIPQQQEEELKQLEIMRDAIGFGVG